MAMLYFKNKYPHLLCKLGVSAKKRFFRMTHVIATKMRLATNHV